MGAGKRTARRTAATSICRSIGKIMAHSRRAMGSDASAT
jgi:hypothetical protein